MYFYSVILFVFFRGVYAINVCTSNTSFSLNCEQNQILHIEEVSLGHHDCQNKNEKHNYDSTKCVANITDIIKKNCAKHNCQINTSIPQLRNVCPGLHRSVLATYSCKELNTNIATTIGTLHNKSINTSTSHSKSKFGCGLNTCRVYCAPGCQRTCFNTYISQCLEPCIPFGCRCREGYYRDPLNLENCLKYEHCPRLGNNTNEEYSPNAAGCQRACGSSQKYVDTCLEICEQYGTCEAGYVCKEGYQRESCFLNIFKKQYNCVKQCHSYYWCV